MDQYLPGIALHCPARMAFELILADAGGKVLAKVSTRLTDNSAPK